LQIYFLISSLVSELLYLSWSWRSCMVSKCRWDF